MLFFINSKTALAQTCGLKNPSFEFYSSCPTGFSQFEKVSNWVNLLPELQSEPDYYNESCSNGPIGGFNYTGFSDVDSKVYSKYGQTGCGRIGMYLNKDTGSDIRLKEYIAQRINLVSGVTYKLTIEVAKSSNSGSSYLQRDLTFFGYNGSIPASHTNFCPIGADSLAAIPRTSISLNNTLYAVTFTPSANYNYLAIGANCNGILNATRTGYIFIDRVELTSTSNTSVYTPIIKSVFNDSSYNGIDIYPTTNNSSSCVNCFSDFRNKMVLKGNNIPNSITATWGQSSSNPEPVVFTSPNDSITSLTGNTSLIPGSYIFYYSFSNGSCVIKDSIIIDVHSQVQFTAGPDILNCGGNNDHSKTNSLIRHYSDPISATASYSSFNRIEFKAPIIISGIGDIYWSMIGADGSEVIFHNPFFPSSPYGGYCGGRVSSGHYISSRTNTLHPNFDINYPMDSIYFILNIRDECNTTLKDTLLYVVNDVSLPSLSKSYCVKDTFVVAQIPPNSGSCIYDTVLQAAQNLTFTWTVDHPGLIILNQNTSDSLKVYIDPTTPKGAHIVGLSVYDALTGCSFFDEYKFYIKDSLSMFSAGDDIYFCNGNNENQDDSSLVFNTYTTRYATRRVIPRAKPSVSEIISNGYSTWWSMIRNDGTEWVFTNPCVPYDGRDEGDVYSYHNTTNPADCGNPSWNSVHGSNPIFYMRNARDTISFIFHLLDICGTDTVEHKDTMVVYLNDVDLPYSSSLVKFCPQDTVYFGQIEDANFRKLDSNKNLIFSWTGPSDVHFIDSTVHDSVRIYFDSGIIAGEKEIRLTVTDKVSGCSWYDESKITIRKELDSIDAGPDIIICNNNFTDEEVPMNAYPDINLLRVQNYSTYWGVMQPDGSEYVFHNPCDYPYTGTGLDEGNLHFKSIPFYSHCGLQNYIYSWRYTFTPDAIFYMKHYGEKKLVWHVIDYCDTSNHLTDTVLIKWDFQEPWIDAGPDQSPSCDNTVLTGSPSASSSGTSGCFKWRQISGPSTIVIHDSTNRVAYLSGLDTIPVGPYQFEYTVGCGICPSYDTMTVFVSPTITKSNFSLSTSWDSVTKICVGDSVYFFAKGSDSYAWYINDSLIKNFSFDSTLTIAATKDSISIYVVGISSDSSCLSTSKNSNIIIIGEVCSKLEIDTIVSCGDTCISTDEFNSSPHILVPCSGTTTTNLGASYSISDSCITYNAVSGVSWSADTICVIMKDTLLHLYDTTVIIMLNCDSTIFLSCTDTMLYIDNFGSSILIDTNLILDSIFSSSGIDSVWLSDTNFNCMNIGLNSVTIYASAFGGEVFDSCISIVTIVDSVKPIVNCHDTLLNIDINGVVRFDTSHLLTNIIENCQLDSVWLSIDSGNCSQDSISVTIFAKDNSGNIGECRARVFVIDTIPPQISCNNSTLYLDSAGQIFVDTNSVLSGVSENCTLDSLWIGLDSSSCEFDSLFVPIYARDVGGNIDSCFATLNILDTISPFISCHDTTLYVNSTGKLYFDTSLVITSYWENCEIDSIWINKDSADCGQDSILVSIYITDVSGNIDSCQSTIYTVDTLAPIINCHDTLLSIDINGVVRFDTSHLVTSITENCKLDSVWLSIDSGNCSQDSISVTISAKDNSGNIGECRARVFVIDTIPPQISCNNSTLYLDSVGQIFVDTSIVLNSVSENCTLDSLWIGLDSSSCEFDSLFVPIYARDVGGNIDSCYATIKVLDTISPFVSCHDTTLYYNSTGKLYFDTSLVITSYWENCEIDNIWINKDSADCGQDSVLVSIYITDVSGNIDSCQSTIYTIDTLAPIINCHDTLFNIDINGVVRFDTSHLLTNITENCQLDSVWLSIDSGSCLIDSNVVLISAIDKSGNIGTCSSIVHFVDTLQPVLICRDTMTYLDSLGEISFNTNLFLSGISDNCLVDSIWINKTNSDCSFDSVAVILYGRDKSGNIGQCQSLLTIKDTIVPIVICHDTTLYLNTQGTIHFDTNQILSHLWDNCKIDSIWINPDSANCTDKSVVAKLWVMDKHGNTAICSSQVTILDTIKPTAICKPTIVQLNGKGIGQLFPNQLDNGSYDNCSIDSTYISKGTFDCLDIGNQMVTLFVIDSSGNTDSCSAIVTVIDTILPIAFAGKDSSFCGISSANMYASAVSGRFSGIWSFDTSYTNYNSTLSVANILLANSQIGNVVEGSYPLIWKITDGKCYDFYDTVVITNYDPPVSKVGDDIELCEGDSAKPFSQALKGWAFGAWFNYYNSNNTPTTNHVNDTLFVANLEEGSIYRFYYEVSNGVCPVDRDSINIIKHHLPVANFMADDTIICAGECINFTNLTTIGIPDSVVNYQWNIGGIMSQDKNPFHCFEDFGYFSVGLKALSDKGCEDSIHKQDYIRVNRNPIANFNVNIDENLGTLIHIRDKALFADFYQYYFGEGGSSIETNPNYNYLDSGEYIIWQVVSDTLGCLDSISKSVKIKILSVFVPNSFTPNNDQINDVFLPIVIGENPNKYNFQVFNRWGELIFESNSRKVGWDGKHRGEIVQQGMYVWRIMLKELDGGTAKEFSGHVNLIR